MQKGPEFSSKTFILRRNRLLGIIIGLLVLLSLAPVFILKISAGSTEPATVVVRVDDVQDFAFRDAQLFLLEEGTENGVPLSLAVIAGMFGEDTGLVHAVKLALESGAEVTVHGWEHEDLAGLSFAEQAALLFRSRGRIREVLGAEVQVLVPPMFSYNEDTLAAMRQEGYTIISTYTDFSEPGRLPEVTSLPATIELSDYANGVWNMKSFDAIKAEASRSIQEYGFAIIVTHPQEFMRDGKLHEDNAEVYRALLRSLAEDYSFKTLDMLEDELQARP